MVAVCSRLKQFKLQFVSKQILEMIYQQLSIRSTTACYNLIAITKTSWYLQSKPVPDYAAICSVVVSNLSRLAPFASLLYQTCPGLRHLLGCCTKPVQACAICSVVVPNLSRIAPFARLLY